MYSAFRGLHLSELFLKHTKMYEYLKINDVKRPIKFGFNALRHFSKHTGIGINELEKIGQNMTFDVALTLIWCGFMDGARVTKEEFNYTIEDLADDLDKDLTVLERAMEIFANQMSNSTEPKKTKEQKKVTPKK